MLDWPEQTQTSPTNTSEIVLVELPTTVIVNGAPTSMAGSLASQFPAASVVAVSFVSPTLIVTAWPGLSLPQIRFSCFC